MTQILTALTPEGIVMGADSSVLLPPQNRGGNPFLYTGSRKLFQWESHGILVGMFGVYPMEVDKKPYFEWMRDWHQIPSSETISLDEVLENLKNDLNARVMPLLPKGAKTGFHVAMWLDSDEFPGTKIPSILKVSNETGSFETSPLVTNEVLVAIYDHRMEKNTTKFPVAFFSDGFIDLGSEQLQSIRTAFADLVKSDVPSNNLDSVLGYVRLLLNLICDLQRVSRIPPYIAPPIETAVSLPSPVSGFSMRF